LSVLALAASSGALFEDQALKFDWRQRYAGKPDGARVWETPSGESALIVRSNVAGKGVLAAVDTDTGHLRWRHELEAGEQLMVSVKRGKLRAESVIFLSRTCP